MGLKIQTGANRELAGFEDWLRQRRMTPAFQLPHFTRWVVRFLRLRGSRRRETWQDTLQVFLEDLGEGALKPWMVRQAADAVTLYCGQYCEQEGTRVIPGGHTPEWCTARGERTREHRVGHQSWPA